MLASYANENRDNWDENLPFVLMAYRSTIHDSTSCSPNLLMFGHEISQPVDLILGNPPYSETHTCPIEYVEWLKNTFEDTYDFVHENLRQSASKQKKYYDRGLKPRNFSPQDFVWRWYPPTAGLKLGLGWTGPFKVLRKFTDVTYEIQKTPKSKPLVVHVDHLKPYEGVLPPKNWVPDIIFPDEQILEVSIPPLLPLEESLMNEDELMEDPPETDRYPVPEVKQTRSGRHVRPRDIYSP
jgi:hypothetical protein